MQMALAIVVVMVSIAALVACDAIGGVVNSPENALLDCLVQELPSGSGDFMVTTRRAEEVCPAEYLDWQEDLADMSVRDQMEAHIQLEQKYELRVKREALEQAESEASPPTE